MTRRLTALITGASAGLGAEFARQLAASGCSLILVARRVERLQAIARQLQGEFGGVEVLCIEADLSRVDAPEHIRDQVSVHGWQVDYLINNAGASGPDFFGTEPWAEHLDYLRLMQTSVAELCHCFIPAMLERGFGRVINVSSVSGRIAAANNCHYGPTKTYLIALSEAWLCRSRGAGCTLPPYVLVLLTQTSTLPPVSMILSNRRPALCGTAPKPWCERACKQWKKAGWFVCRVVSTAGLIRYSSLSGRAGCYCGRNKLGLAVQA
jgi:NADP-dependent 3-hydroxy acid dehydrogenase YdfG